MNNEIICAFATDDGKAMMTRHFGDAQYYDVYRITQEQSEFIERIENSTEEEDGVHADPRKAGSVRAMLQSRNVQVCMSPVFGPNIKRIKNYFVCIVAGSAGIEDSIARIQKHIESIKNHWAVGEGRDIIIWSRDEDVS